MTGCFCVRQRTISELQEVPAHLGLLERHPADVRRVESFDVVQRANANEQSCPRRLVDDWRVVKLSEIVDAQRRLTTPTHIVY